MSFQTRSFYTVIIGLPVVKPESNSVFWIEYIASDAKRQNGEWTTQKDVMHVPSQLWVQSFDFERLEGEVISGYYKTCKSHKQTEK